MLFRTLDALVLDWMSCGDASPLVVVRLKDHQARCGRSDLKELRKSLNADLGLLCRTLVSYEDRKYGKSYTIGCRDVLIGKTYSIHKGFLRFEFSMEFYDILKKSQFMSYPMLLLRINLRRNPNSYNLLRKLAEHKNMNYFKSSPDIVSVKTLLDCAPAIPVVEVIRESDRHIEQRIIGPFVRDMERLNDVLTWEFCCAKGVQLGEGELPVATYDQFASLYIRVYWRDYPMRSKPDKNVSVPRKK